MRLVKFLSWTGAHLAWATMSISPLALGAESAKISKQKAQQYIQELGLTKPTTVGDFWDRSKAYYPGYMYSELEAFAKQYKNMPMPEFTVSSAKATDDLEIPVLNFTNNGKNHTIQIYGEKNKWAKYDNTKLTENDFKYPNDILKRIIANDVNVKKEIDLQNKKTSAGSALNIQIQNEYKKDFARFKGFPVMTPQLWKSMKREQRAALIVKMRLMWRSAERVLALTESKGRSAYEPTPTDKYFKALFNEANAQVVNGNPDIAPPSAEPQVTQGNADMAPPPANERTSPTAGVKLKSNPASNKKNPYGDGDCLVAGYIGSYSEGITNVNGPNRAGCSVEKAISKYKDVPELKYIQEANATCSEKGASYVACNPTVYGFPGGAPKCVNKLESNFLIATHFEGPCDKASPLSNSKDVVPFSPEEKDYSKIQPREKQLLAIDADQQKQDYALTKNFLDGFLKKKNMGGLDTLLSGPWSEAADNELLGIQSQFEAAIKKSIEICERDIVSKPQEPKQKGACDQLHRRWLFTERFIAQFRNKACPPDSSYIGLYDKGELSSTITEPTRNKNFLNANKFTDDSLLCKCNSTQKEVPFNGSCLPQVIVTGVSCKKNPKHPDCLADVIEKSCPAGANRDANQCICASDSEKKFPFGTSPEEGKKICEGNSILPLVIGVGIVAALALYWRNTKPNPIIPPKPPLCAANQKLVGSACLCQASCPAGSNINANTCECSSNPPVIKCMAPKEGVYPMCTCPASNTCTPGQQVYNLQSCQCDTVKTPAICPDGTPAPNGNADSCPKPVVTPPSEGGSGTNCPQGGCNGGIPTGK